MQPGNDYDFILSKGAPQGGALNSQSMRTRILIAGGGFVVLMIILALVFGALLSGGDPATAELTAVAQKQNEIIRIADIGVKQADGSAAKNYALTTDLAMKTDQSIFLAALKSGGVSVSKGDLAAGKNARTDQILNQADQGNNFDATFTTTIQSLITDYRASIKKAYDTSKNAKTKKVLSDCFTHANTLLPSSASDQNKQ